jgi:hypothetical protein
MYRYIGTLYFCSLFFIPSRKSDLRGWSPWIIIYPLFLPSQEKLDKVYLTGIVFLNSQKPPRFIGCFSMASFSKSISTSPLTLYSWGLQRYSKYLSPQKNHSLEWFFVSQTYDRIIHAITECGNLSKIQINLVTTLGLCRFEWSSRKNRVAYEMYWMVHRKATESLTKKFAKSAKPLHLFPVAGAGGN